MRTFPLRSRGNDSTYSRRVGRHRAVMPWLARCRRTSSNVMGGAVVGTITGARGLAAAATVVVVRIADQRDVIDAGVRQQLRYDVVGRASR